MILIVGSRGFLGSSLVSYFKNREGGVIKVDKNFSKNQYNIDIVDLQKLENIFKKNKIKFVLNLAAEPASSNS